MSGWSAMRSFGRDAQVAEHRLAPGTLKRVVALARPYRAWLAAFLGLVVVDGLLVVASPLLLRHLIDSGVHAGDRRVVVVFAALVAAVALVEAGLSLAERWLSARIGEGLIYDLRSAVFEHVQRQPLAFFTRSQTGSLVSRLNSDVVGAQQAFTSTASGVVSNAVTLVAVLVAMAVMSWQVTLLALVLVPLFVLPARRVGRRLSALRREGMQVNADLGNRMTERFNVAGALLVKLYGDPATEAAQYRERADRVRRIGIRTALSSRVFFVALSALAALATAMVYGVGGWLAVSGAVSTGSLVALAALLGRLYGPITGLSNVQVDVMTALVSFERVFEVLDLVPAVQDRPDARALPPGPLGVDLVDVVFAYPDPASTTLRSLEGETTPARGGSAEVPAPRLPEGLDTVVGDRGHRLSGGEKQRVALARLLLQAPAVVVLDEATAHLDSESEAAVQGALDTALAGRTSIVIAHRLSTVRDADLICVVDGGRIVERGRHPELLRRGGLYADLYRTQFATDRGADRGTDRVAG